MVQMGRFANGKGRHQAPVPKWARALVLAAVALAVSAVGLRAATQATAITSVAVLRSTWMAMTVAVSYKDSLSRDTLTLGVQWRRLNGRPLKFTPALAQLAPGSGAIELHTTYHGVLPPPTPMLMHLVLTARDGHVVVQRDCDMSLVNEAGKEAWAGDLMKKGANDLTWRVRTCH